MLVSTCNINKCTGWVVPMTVPWTLRLYRGLVGTMTVPWSRGYHDCTGDSWLPWLYRGLVVTMTVPGTCGYHDYTVDTMTVPWVPWLYRKYHDCTVGTSTVPCTRGLYQGTDTSPTPGVTDHYTPRVYFQWPQHHCGIGKSQAKNRTFPSNIKVDKSDWLNSLNSS